MFLTSLVPKLDDETPDSPYSILACGHLSNGDEAWEAIAVILKENLDGQPAFSTGHWCRRCRSQPAI